MKPLEVLKEYFGYNNFRIGQEEVINALLQQKDVLGIMPTGAGKSICYQVPALCSEGVSLVISPLISLMKDQVDALKEMGIKAALINSTLSATHYQEVMQEAKRGHYKLIYVAPERLESYDFINLCQSLPIDFVIVDEAHCVSQWGHDFRPSYTNIDGFIRHLPQRPVVGAFTATATPKVKEDIMTLLRLREPYCLTTGFDRSNLYFEVEKPKHKLEWTLTHIQKHKEESGIIYCATRKTVDALYEKLRLKEIDVVRYHAGLSENQRNGAQEAFLYDKAKIMIATNAFGMGIDKSNVRYVVHYNMPKNMESYYQEAGRAGRDGLPSRCTLLYSASDIMTNRLLIENSGGGVDQSLEYEKLNQMVDYCNTEDCLRSTILRYFGEQPTKPCQHCSNCNSDIEQQDITIEAQKILSCIKRMGERFGMGLVIEVLKGANTQKIRQFGFETLSTYGIMKGFAKETIQEIIAFLIAEKYIELYGDKFPVLRLTSLSYEVLRGQVQVNMRMASRKEETVFTNQEDVLPIDLELLAQLKTIRTKLAQEHQIPPFIVFSDVTLNEMSQYYPTEKEEMLQISGIGATKYEKYGIHFEQCIKDYVLEKEIVKPSISIKSLQKTVISKSKKEPTLKNDSGLESHLFTYDLYKQGMDLETIAKERGLSRSTIENHLSKCIEEGLELDLSSFMSEEEQLLIEKAVQEIGPSLLKPIKESLPENISYTAIKMVLATMKASNKV